eukprot:257931-Chlamydomonas_euryale.AAC.1
MNAGSVREECGQHRAAGGGGTSQIRPACDISVRAGTPLYIDITTGTLTATVPRHCYCYCS